MNKVLIAFTSGVILGILFAPAHGKDTRKKIADAGLTLKEGWNDIADTITGKIDGMRESVDNFADRAVEKVESTQFDTSEKYL
jgi:gas vesicle protein